MNSYVFSWMSAHAACAADSTYLSGFELTNMILIDFLYLDLLLLFVSWFEQSSKQNTKKLDRFEVLDENDHLPLVWAALDRLTKLILLLWLVLRWSEMLSIMRFSKLLFLRIVIACCCYCSNSIFFWCCSSLLLTSSVLTRFSGGRKPLKIPFDVSNFPEETGRFSVS